MADAGVGNVDRPESAYWRIALIGPMRVERGDGASCRLPGRRERALLAYLALAPAYRESRRNLAALLWGDDADNLTLDNLRTCLWSLRRALGEEDQRLIVADREWIGLDPAMVDIDARRLAPALSSRDANALDRLLQGQDGALLDGLDLDGSSFQDWARTARARHTDAVIVGLTRLMELRRAEGDNPAALHAGARILRMDPFNEAVLRSMLEIYAATGRRHLAFQAFRRFAEKLQADLGVEPEPETTALFNRIAGSPTSGAEPPSKAETTTTAGPGHSATGEAGATSTKIIPAARPRPHRSFWLFAVITTASTLAMLALLASISVGYIFWRIPELAPDPFPTWILQFKRYFGREPPSLAVLPFQSHGDVGAGDFADAIAEGVTSALATASEIFVVSRSSTFAINSAVLAPQEIARKLNVRYLLEGSVTRVGEIVTVRMRLIDTAKNDHAVPVGEFERPVGDFFSLQREITREVVTTLQVKLTEGEQERLGHQATRNYQAWLLAAQGHKELRTLAPDSNWAARRHFDEALALDPDYAGAISGLAWTYLVEPFLGQSRNVMESLRKAAELAARLQKLHDQRATTFALIGAVALFSGDIERAIISGREAVNREPNDADSAALLALTMIYAGEPQHAMLLLSRAMKLKPYPPRWYYWLDARAHRHAGKFDDAIRILTSDESGGGRSPLPTVELLLAYAESGALDDARQVAQDIRRQFPEFVAAQWGRVPAYRNPDRRRRDLAALAAAGLDVSEPVR